MAFDGRCIELLPIVSTVALVLWHVSCRMRGESEICLFNKLNHKLVLVLKLLHNGNEKGVEVM